MVKTEIAFLRLNLFYRIASWSFRTVFFNLSSAEPRGSANSKLGSLKILKIALFWMSRFRQMLFDVSNVPATQKRLKNTCLMMKIWLSTFVSGFRGCRRQTGKVWRFIRQVLRRWRRIGGIWVDGRRSADTNFLR